MASAPFELQGIEPIERLGGGGFGEVWLARQTNIDRMVAVKIGHQPIDDKTVQLRFERECIALGRLSGNRNIIEVFTAGQLPDNRPYLILEYISGGTMWQRVHREPLSEAELIDVGIELADALAKAHDTGVLHRDLKPENVFLRPNGQVVLGDFGIARLHDGANTTSQAIAASVAYAAPEILAGKPPTVVADVYGLGICLVAAILRSVPFVEQTDESIHPIINRVLSAHPPNLRHYGISDGFASLIEQTIAKEPDQRPPTAADVRDRLQQLASGAPPPTTAAAPGGGAGGATQRVESSMPSLANLPPPPPSQPPVGVPPYNPFSGVPSPPAQPYPQQVSPHQASPPQQVSPHQVSPAQPPAYAISDPRHTAATPGQGDNNRVYLFIAAFIATLVIGGIILYVAINLGNNDESGLDTLSADDGSERVDDTDSGTDSDTGSGTESPATEPEEVTDVEEPDTGSSDRDVDTTGPLTLPLTVDDVPATFGAEPLVEPDNFGPATPQFCQNIPATTGMTDWVGETITEPVRQSPFLFQELVRFDTSENARAFADAYVGTVDCTEWEELATTADAVDILYRPEVVPDPTSYGDGTWEITFEAETIDTPTLVLYGRITVVHASTDVLLFNLTSLDLVDLDEFDGMLEVAVSRLGY